MFKLNIWKKQKHNKNDFYAFITQQYDVFFLGLNIFLLNTELYYSFNRLHTACTLYD